MMEQQLKERLVGATVLVVLAIIVIPIVLDGPGSGKPAQQRLDLPAAGGDGERRTVRIPLDNEAGQAAQERNTVSQQEPEEVPVTRPDATDAGDRQGEESNALPEEPETTVAEVEPEESPVEPAVAGNAATTANAASKPWTVQVGSFSSEQNAAGLVNRLKSLGYADAFVSRYDDGSRIHYRVRVGGFDDREAAAARAAEIRDRSGEPARPAKN